MAETEANVDASEPDTEGERATEGVVIDREAEPSTEDDISQLKIFQKDGQLSATQIGFDSGEPELVPLEDIIGAKRVAILQKMQENQETRYIKQPAPELNRAGEQAYVTVELTENADGSQNVDFKTEYEAMPSDGVFRTKIREKDGEIEYWRAGQEPGEGEWVSLATELEGELAEAYKAMRENGQDFLEIPDPDNDTETDLAFIRITYDLENGVATSELVHRPRPVEEEEYHDEPAEDAAQHEVASHTMTTANPKAKPTLIPTNSRKMADKKPENRPRATKPTEYRNPFIGPVAKPKAQATPEATSSLIDWMLPPIAPANEQTKPENKPADNEAEDVAPAAKANPATGSTKQPYMAPMPAAEASTEAPTETHTETPPTETNRSEQPQTNKNTNNNRTTRRPDTTPPGGGGAEAFHAQGQAESMPQAIVDKPTDTASQPAEHRHSDQENATAAEQRDSTTTATTENHSLRTETDTIQTKEISVKPASHEMQQGQSISLRQDKPAIAKKEAQEGEPVRQELAIEQTQTINAPEATAAQTEQAAPEAQDQTSAPENTTTANEPAEAKVEITTQQDATTPQETAESQAPEVTTEQPSEVVAEATTTPSPKAEATPAHEAATSTAQEAETTTQTPIDTWRESFLAAPATSTRTETPRVAQEPAAATSPARTERTHTEAPAFTSAQTETTQTPNSTTWAAYAQATNPQTTAPTTEADDDLEITFDLPPSTGRRRTTPARKAARTTA